MGLRWIATRTVFNDEGDCTAVRVSAPYLDEVGRWACDVEARGLDGDGKDSGTYAHASTEHGADPIAALASAASLGVEAAMRNIAHDLAMRAAAEARRDAAKAAREVASA